MLPWPSNPRLKTSVAWCIDGNGPDHLCRAAEDEYEVAGGLVQWLAQSLADELSPMSVTIIRTRLNLECDQRRLVRSGRVSLPKAISQQPFSLNGREERNR